MNATNIRLITAQDVAYEQVKELREEVLRRPLGISLKDEDLSGEIKEFILIALTDEGELTGCLQLHPVDDAVIKFRQMAVAPDFQGKNIGRLLMDAGEKLAASKGFSKIVLHARMVAAGFYERLGYTVSGDEFTEVGLPHKLMQKTIG